MTITSGKRIAIILAVIAAILALPLIGMQFSDDVDWNLFDFIVAGALLLGTGAAIEVAIRTVRGTGTRLVVCIIILLALFLVWAELAVGVFGTPFAGS